ncbi:MAG: glutamine-hydrolyzing GMP synthase [Candidatus Undinarchaeales archaeon]|nr:glutamine-hydrolyzing GMP synthase [Candidatus Undinarchaeales archaeon]MDP7491611.1 glutamine-hydrolyzing GMP synthase [Candidatus Undinarchaeales archaeon]
MATKDEVVVVLDFGGQYCHLIARRLRELGVYSFILPYTVKVKRLKELPIKGIVLSGGPSSVYEKGAPKLPKAVLSYALEEGIPMLGICYGHQLLAKMLGGTVESGKEREYGRATFYPRRRTGLFEGLWEEETVWMSHGDLVKDPPEGYEVLGTTSTCPVAAFGSEDSHVYGIQFHPEVAHTPCGRKVLGNFLDITGAARTWSMAPFVEETVARIKKEVGKKRVLLGLSGGVDSSVVAALLHKAIGSSLHCVFVDNGLLRDNDRPFVEDIFSKNVPVKNLHIVDASERFLTALKGVTDPEEKRRIIGHTFIDVFEEKAKILDKKVGRIEFLAQGTIYPDRVESASTSKHSAKIKSHHNVALPEGMRFSLIEPLAELYKDEVRAIGATLGLPRELVDRQPFPGPGLAVRCLGKVTRERLDTLRLADRIVREEVAAAGITKELWQYFPALLPVRTVGVMGDARTYNEAIAIRCVQSIDAMTANVYPFDWDVLRAMAARIVNEVKGVNRVFYDITDKPPATIEME